MSAPAAVRSGYRALLSVAAPLAGVQLAQVALTTTDLAMLGTLDVTAVAAGGLAILLYNQVRTMCVGVVTPLGNMVAGAAGRADGAADAPGGDTGLAGETRGLVRSGLAMASVVGVLAALVLVLLGGVLPWFGQAESVVAVALPVMAALAPGLVPMLWLNVLRQFAVGMQRPGSLLGVTIVSIGVNLVLDGGFLHGWLGMPVLGATGVGVATTLVQLFNVAVYYAMLRRDRVLSSGLSLRVWKADRRRVRELVRLGVPVALTYGSEAGITSVATLVMGAFGPLALAAHSVVNQVAYIVYQTMIGLSQGASILVSRAAGGTDAATGEARRVAVRAFVIAGALQAVLAAVYLVAPGAVLRPFLDPQDTAVLGLASTLLLIAIVQQVTKGTQNIAVGLMRGLRDTRAGFRASVVGYWAVGVPAMLLLGPVLGLDGPGVWLGLGCGFGTTAVLLVRRFAGAVR